MLLIVRERRHDARGETMPYVLLGPVYYRLHLGGRPMEIEWELEFPMPARMFQELKVAAGWRFRDCQQGKPVAVLEKRRIVVEPRG